MSSYIKLIIVWLLKFAYFTCFLNLNQILIGLILHTFTFVFDTCYVKFLNLNTPNTLSSIACLNPNKNVRSIFNLLLEVENFRTIFVKQSVLQNYLSWVAKQLGELRELKLGLLREDILRLLVALAALRLLQKKINVYVFDLVSFYRHRVLRRALKSGSRGQFLKRKSFTLLFKEILLFDF